MAAKRQRVPIQVNQFVGGINTEANPLSYPPNASLDESNMEFGRDGSRIRRNGFDFEFGYNLVNTNLTRQADLTLAHSQTLWENPGGFGNKQFVVVQVGNYLAVHDLNNLPLSSTPVFSKTFSEDTYNNTFDYAVVDGILVVATGEKSVYSFTYDGEEVSVKESSLLIRDLFGVEATAGGIETTDPSNTQKRPSTITPTHLYNLRNQTFALPRVDEDDNLDLVDPVKEFELAAASQDIPVAAYPSNADNAIRFTFANANHSSDREVERFHGETMFKSPPSTTKAPVGYFIIDALERGVSRLQEENKLRAEQDALEFIVTNLKKDRTPGGARVLAQYSGRVWYAGFSAVVEDGDKKSPRLSSYVLFSQVVQNPSDINLCYQASDPTSISDSDLADTDGGFLKIDGAYNIKALIPVDSSLFVFAENGIWRVVGIDDNTFTATGYSVSKLSERGCISGQSAVSYNKNLVYWSEDGIYGIGMNQTGIWEVTSITQNTIQTYYDELSATEKASSSGYYDADNMSVRWLWTSSDTEDRKANELVVNLRYSAFVKNEVTLPNNISSISSVSGGQETEGTTTLTITDSGDIVTDGGEVVTISASTIQRGVTDAFYTVIVEEGTNLEYSFGRYNNVESPYDWSRYGTPTDTPAYLIAGSVNGGDARLRKNVPYLTVYFKQTDSDVLDSQCILTAQWDWSQSYETGRWTSPRQIYRPQRNTNVGGILATRNKIRGSGQSVAFRFDSVEGFGMRVYGWEFNIEATATE